MIEVTCIDMSIFAYTYNKNFHALLWNFAMQKINTKDMRNFKEV